MMLRLARLAACAHQLEAAQQFGHADNASLTQAVLLDADERESEIDRDDLCQVEGLDLWVVGHSPVTDAGRQPADGPASERTEVDR